MPQSCALFFQIRPNICELLIVSITIVQPKWHTVYEFDLIPLCLWIELDVNCEHPDRTKLDWTGLARPTLCECVHAWVQPCMQQCGYSSACLLSVFRHKPDEHRSEFVVQLAVSFGSVQRPQTKTRRQVPAVTDSGREHRRS